MGRAARASQMTTGLLGRVAQLDKLAEQPGSSVTGLMNRILKLSERILAVRERKMHSLKIKH